MSRYRVKKPVFIDGNYVDPKGRVDVYVNAPDGLEGDALEAVEAEEAKDPAPDDGAGSGEEKVVEPYRPAGLERELAGETDRETIDKLMAELAKKPEAEVSAKPTESGAVAASVSDQAGGTDQAGGAGSGGRNGGQGGAKPTGGKPK